MAGRAIRRVGVVLAVLVVLALVAALAFSLYARWRAERAEERFAAALGPPGLARFVRLYHSLLARGTGTLKQIDLRYANGFAARWTELLAPEGRRWLRQADRWQLW